QTQLYSQLLQKLLCELDSSRMFLVHFFDCLRHKSDLPRELVNLDLDLSINSQCVILSTLYVEPFHYFQFMEVVIYFPRKKIYFFQELLFVKF
ncbi:hypothetical protein EGW08_000558, partial [Elysia chlorotica]